MEYNVKEQLPDGRVIVKIIMNGKECGIDHDETHNEPINNLKRCPVCDKIIVNGASLQNEY